MPFIPLKYLPFSDISQHLAAGAVVKDMVLGGPLSSGYHLVFFPNILGWLLIACLAIFFDILTAGKIIVFIYFLATPISLYYYLEDSRKHLSLISFLFLNNYALNMGFLNFILSVPLLFFALGAFKKGSKLFYILSFLLFLSHAATYGLFMFILLIFFLAEKKNKMRQFLYALIIFVIWISTIIVFSGNIGSSGVQAEKIIHDVILLLFYGFVANITSSLVAGFQFFRPDYIGMIGLIVIALAYSRQLFIKHDYDRNTLLIILFLLSIAVFFPSEIPMGSGIWNTLNGRFLFIALLFNIADLRLGKKNETIMITLSLFLVLINSLTMIIPYSEADARLVNYYEPIVNKLPSGGKVYVVEETGWIPGYFFTSNHTYGASSYSNYLSGYYSLKGGISSTAFSSGRFGKVWPLIYSNYTHHPLCQLNRSYDCYLCDNKGFECFYSNKTKDAPSQDNASVYCDYCTRPMALVCEPLQVEEENKFIDTGLCIPCSSGNLTCILENQIIKENYDYLVAFSTGDDIGDYLINGSEPYLKNQDVIVYEIN
jgi:hypothetical protein